MTLLEKRSALVWTDCLCFVSQLILIRNICRLWLNQTGFSNKPWLKPHLLYVKGVFQHAEFSRRADTSKHAAELSWFMCIFKYPLILTEVYSYMLSFSPVSWHVQYIKFLMFYKYSGEKGWRTLMLVLLLLANLFFLVNILCQISQTTFKYTQGFKLFNWIGYTDMAT